MAVPKLSRRAKIILIVVIIGVLVAGLAAVGIWYWRKNNGGGGGGGGATMNFDATTKQWVGTFTVTYDSSLPNGANNLYDSTQGGAVIYPGYMTQDPSSGYLPSTSQTWGDYPTGPSTITPMPNDQVTTAVAGANTATIPASFSTLAYGPEYMITFS